jgi:hypothetical protein
MAHAEEESKEGRKEGRMHDSCAASKGTKKKKNTLVHICLLCFDSFLSRSGMIIIIIIIIRVFAAAPEERLGWCCCCCYSFYSRASKPWSRQRKKKKKQ